MKVFRATVNVVGDTTKLGKALLDNNSQKVCTWESWAQGRELVADVQFDYSEEIRGN